MLFNTAQFALFFAAVWLACRSLTPRSRPALLLGASVVFYALWYPAYLVLLFFDLVVNYQLLKRIETGERRRAWLAVSVVFTLGLLAYFKYAAFLINTVAVLFAAGHSQTATAVVPLFLPLGISFYSFQIMALAIDRSRGHGPKPDSFAHYALFISFFPQLIAGPIVRGSELLGQLREGGRISRERTRTGIWLVTSGLFKKVVMADFLLAPFADSVFSTPGLASAPFHWLALYSFTFQIYFDFSGYTDIARGAAYMLGFELPLNFREPYLSRDPSEFWRRWHITLSRWLGDYLYVPLGGNRRGRTRTYVNLAVTMILGGLWHGASWTFAVWGAIHGLVLIVYRAFAVRRDPDRELSWSDAARVLITFEIVSLAWVFFRSPDFSSAMAFFSGMAGNGSESGWPVLQCGVVVVAAGLHVLERIARTRVGLLRQLVVERLWAGVTEGAVIGVLLALVVAASGTGGEFIYFQF